MAWTEIHYQCSHSDRVQLYGPGRGRAARAWSFSQKLCPACWRAKMEAHANGSPTRPRVVEHVGSGRARFEVWDTFECWDKLVRRGYRLMECDRPGIRGYTADRIQPYLAWGPPARAYVHTLHSEAEYWAERKWLAAECSAILPEDAMARSEPKRYKSPTIPRRLAAADFSPALALKVERSGATIRNALARARRPYIAFSGGKDSTALLALVHAIAPEVPVIWSDDELEFPETVLLMEHMRYAVAGPFRIVAGHATHAGWFTSWRDRPFWRDPLPATESIPGLMEEWAAGEDYDLTFLGLRGDESKMRGAFLHEAGAIYRRRHGLVCSPLWDWDQESIWAFIAATGAPYNAAYDRYRALGLPPELQRIGPLPLSPRSTLAEGWPEMLARLEVRYGHRWTR